MSHGPDESAASADPEVPCGCRWVRAAGTLWRNSGDTVILLPDAREGQIPLVMSGSAVLVWELLADPVTLSELAAELAAVYEMEAPVIAADLEPILEVLHAATAIERLP